MAHCSLPERWGCCYIAREPTEPQTVLALALRCCEAAARLSRRRLVRLCLSPGRPAARRLGSALGLVPLGTMGRGLPGSLQARGARLRTLPAPPEATLARAATQSRRLPDPDGSAMPAFSMSPAVPRRWQSYVNAPWCMPIDVGACM